MFGYPEKDVAYMGALYGPRYAKTYKSLGHISTEVNRVAFHGARLLFKSTVFCCVVPVMALYATLFSVSRTARLVAFSTFNTVGSAINTLALTASTGAAAVFSSATTLGTKGWLVVFGMLWLGLAEYYSMI
ncbi:hypothetical protein BJ912DRAFT_298900 [Pholiota molesta]|nr:hypothetical protein BJ912DRAFT_298900 [Pholiota molesta]